MSKWFQINLSLAEEHIIFPLLSLGTFLPVSKATNEWFHSADLPVIAHRVTGEPGPLLGTGDFQSR